MVMVLMKKQADRNLQTRAIGFSHTIRTSTRELFQTDKNIIVEINNFFLKKIQISKFPKNPLIFPDPVKILGAGLMVAFAIQLVYA